MCFVRTVWMPPGQNWLSSHYAFDSDWNQVIKDCDVTAFQHWPHPLITRQKRTDVKTTGEKKKWNNQNVVAFSEIDFKLVCSVHSAATVNSENWLQSFPFCSINTTSTSVSWCLMQLLSDVVWDCRDLKFVIGAIGFHQAKKHPDTEMHSTAPTQFEINRREPKWRRSRLGLFRSAVTQAKRLNLKYSIAVVCEWSDNHRSEYGSYTSIFPHLVQVEVLIWSLVK